MLSSAPRPPRSRFRSRRVNQRGRGLRIGHSRLQIGSHNPQTTALFFRPLRLEVDVMRPSASGLATIRRFHGMPQFFAYEPYRFASRLAWSGQYPDFSLSGKFPGTHGVTTQRCVWVDRGGPRAPIERPRCSHSKAGTPNPAERNPASCGRRLPRLDHWPPMP